MGVHDVCSREDEERSRAFREALLDDLEALQTMFDSHAFETYPLRIGAEQEMLLVDSEGRPAPVACELLSDLDPETFTTEIGRFNLEANLAPLVFTGNCLETLERDLSQVVAGASQAASRFGARVLLSGTLPTARVQDMTLANLTPKARYEELNRIVMRLRGGSYHLFIKGADELELRHDNVMPEACCTSFQLHLQVDPSRFTELYNAAQLALGPVLAVAANGPMLLGRRLWHESRIALFQHAVDERSASQMARSHPTRVTFGEEWISSGAIELWRDQIMRFKPIFTAEPGEMSTAMLRRRAVPQLAAMRLHNGTIWRWNRPCYGVSSESGRPHLRIEFRALPSGPTVLDEVANAAFLLGLVHGLANETGDVGSGIAFEAARDNFFAAARDGLETQLHWFDGEVAPAAKLITSRLLPLAFRGLTQAGLDAESSNRYLKIIEDRVAWGVTGSCYVLGAVMQLDTQGSPLARDQRLVRVLLERQSHIGVPVHCWNPPSEEERMHPCYMTVGEIMSTDLSTVAPGDPVSLATGIMDWRHVHHVPVEDDSGKLVGMLSHRDIGTPEAPPVAVRDLMVTEVVSVTPASKTIDALKLMRSRSIDCLPVIENGQLVGLVTSHDMLAILELLLSREAVSPPGQAASASAV